MQRFAKHICLFIVNVLLDYFFIVFIQKFPLSFLLLLFEKQSFQFFRKKYWYQNELEFLPKRNKKNPCATGIFSFNLYSKLYTLKLSPQAQLRLALGLLK